MIDTEELALIGSSFSRVLETTSAPGVPAALLELGWAELLETEAATVVPVTAEVQGRLRTGSPILDLVVLSAAGLPPTADIPVVLPKPSRSGAESVTAASGSTLYVEGLALPGYERADSFLLMGRDALWRVGAASLEAVPSRGGDLAHVTGRVPVEETTVVGDRAAVLGALSAGRLFLASELLGLAGVMLVGARDYVLQRHQFGHPVGAFQSVKHRLADVHVAITAGRAGVTTAWSDGTWMSAMAAKCLAGRAFEVAAGHCHQVQGGIAFTVEHGFHRLIARGQLLDALLGTAHDLTLTLGEEILAAAAVPFTPRLDT